MEKEKFQKKCQELIDYENKIFKDIPIHVSNINKNLEKKGLLIKVERWWSLPKSGVLLERPSISKGYYNSVDVFFIKKEDEIDEKGEFLYLSFVLTEYNIGIFGKKCFSKNKIQKFIKEIQIAHKEIQKFGLNEVVSLYKLK